MLSGIILGAIVREDKAGFSLFLQVSVSHFYCLSWMAWVNMLRRLGLYIVCPISHNPTTYTRVNHPGVVSPHAAIFTLFLSHQKQGAQI